MLLLPIVIFFNPVWFLYLLLGRSPLKLLDRLALAIGHGSLAFFQLKVLGVYLSGARGDSPEPMDAFEAISPPVLLILVFFALLCIGVQRRLRSRETNEGILWLSYSMGGIFALVMANTLILPLLFK